MVMDLSLLKLMKICSTTMNDTNLGMVEREECLRILEKLIDILYRDKIEVLPQQYPIELILQELDILNPKSFLSMHSVPFFIVKSWVRL